ncbi:MAG: peptidylprolyl isomerase [Pseudolabrys sp.]|nr:peptidylprolyl isomerase [Pseudolabrys sp.]MDP2293862.1 peptidylprolyl isomerase [Pseudolabrys sp.]
MSCSVHAQLPTGRPVNVTVNGIAIARDEIVREMQHHPAGKPIAAWQQAARALVIRELLMQEARRLAITPQPLTEDGRRETDEEAIMRGLIDREIVVPQADDETCRRYYERRTSQFRSPDIYEAAHILFAALPNDKEAYTKARADAEGVLAALVERPESFATLAGAYSGCASAAQGGNLGQITTGQTTPEFEQALVALAPGELCAAPVATRYGFHIIRLDRMHEGRLLPYDAVAGRIADYLNESVRRRADAQYIARLVSKAQIEGIDLAGADAHRVH